MEFRRNHATPMRGRSFLRRAILLVFVVVAMIFWLVTISQSPVIPKEKASLSVTFLDSTHYLIGKDTTNYDDFASILTREISNMKKKHPAEIFLYLEVPKDKNTGELSDIVQIANAFEGVILKISTIQN